MENDTYRDAPFMTVAEACQELGGVIPPSTFYRLTQTGQIPSTRIGRRVYISARWVERTLEAAR